MKAEEGYLGAMKILNGNISTPLIADSIYRYYSVNRAVFGQDT